MGAGDTCGPPMGAGNTCGPPMGVGNTSVLQALVFPPMAVLTG